MKIITQAAFLLMPVGTVFSKYEPCVASDLAIKGRTVAGIDFYYQQIAEAFPEGWESTLSEFERTGASFEMDLACQGRDGLFETEQRFLVWEHSDVCKLIDRLKQALRGEE